MTLPEYALIGQHYIYIWDLNSAWAARHKSDFFPKENLRAWIEAFGNFLKHTRPSKPSFDLVKEDIEFSLQNIDHFKADGHEPINRTDTLGEHLFLYYLWEVYPLTETGSLLKRFYKETENDKPRWSRLFDFVGRLLGDSGKQLNESLIQRIIQFFEWRLEQKEPSELKEFTFWLGAGCLDAKWRLKAYSEILDIIEPEAIGFYSQMKTLRELLAKHTPLVVECFAKLSDCFVKNSSSFYNEPDKVLPILRAGLNHEKPDVQKNAKRAQENLLKCGLSEYLDAEN